MGISKLELGPMPASRRFYVYSESCYTEPEITLRTNILTHRANSGIDKEYLNNPSSWFADNQQAFINPYENSWFYSNSYKTRHVLSRDDFYVQPIDSQRLQWSSLHHLMQNVGDYLLLRNTDLRTEHLNQPMNFFLLDINHILKGLSQNPSLKQVKEQMVQLNRYIRTVEKGISSEVGSDRLFLARFRQTVEDRIVPQLDSLNEAKLLKEKLVELSKRIKQLSTERNRVLHFALNINSVNPHSYDFSTHLLEASAHPTKAAKDCASNSKELSTQVTTILQLTAEQLKNCPHFNLITMDKPTLDHFSSAISDLNELERFQQVTSQIIDLLGQGGEVYTIYQFKEQLVSLLKQIDKFVDESFQNIDKILRINTEAYHKAIQLTKGSSFLKEWFSSEQDKLKTFIKNQDTLSQFPSTSTDLLDTNKALKEHVSEVVSHLTQVNSHQTTFEGLAIKAQEVNALLNSMHQWIKTQYEIKGLEGPKAPEPLKLMTPSQRTTSSTSSEIPQRSPIYTTSSPTFFTSPSSETLSLCAPDDNECSASQTTQKGYGSLGLILLIPIGLIALFLLYNRNSDTPKESNKKTKVKGTQAEFDDYKAKFEDLHAVIKGIERSSGRDHSDGYAHLMEDFEGLKKKSDVGIYSVGKLKNIYGDLVYYYNDACNPKSKINLG